MKNEIIHFWGEDHPKMYEELSFCIDKENKILQTIEKIIPFQYKTILDVGSGLAKYPILVSSKAKLVYALEPSVKLNLLAQKKAKKLNIHNIKFLTATAEDIPLKAKSVDLVLSFWSYFFGKGHKGLEEVYRILKPKGFIFIIQNCGHDQLSRLWSSEYEFKCLRYREWFVKNGFKNKVIQTDWDLSNLSCREASKILKFLYQKKGEDYIKTKKDDKLKIEYKVTLYYKKV